MHIQDQGKIPATVGPKVLTEAEARVLRTVVGLPTLLTCLDHTTSTQVRLQANSPSSCTHSCVFP